MNLRVRSALLVTEPQAALMPRGARETKNVRAVVMAVRKCMFFERTDEIEMGSEAVEF